MKKILMLGGATTQLSAIKKAKELGYYVVVCDGVIDIPGKFFADEFHHISTTDEQLVLELARTKQVDGILCYGADSGATTAAYVAQQLDLPTHPLQSVEILTNKELFRQFQQKHHFHVPYAKAFHTYEEALAAIGEFQLPVMIKPVDSSGSRGVAKIDAIEQLKAKVEQALAFSACNRFIVEQYIENNGPHIGGDGFSLDGKLVFRSFSNEYFNENAVNPFVPIIGIWPYEMGERLEQKIHDEIQRMLDLLSMKTGSYNFDIRLDEHENVYLIEIAPRNGGDCNPEAICYATGVDVIAYTLKAAVGEDCSDVTLVKPKGYWATYVVNSDRSGVYKGIDYDPQFLSENIVASEMLVTPGERIVAMTGSHEKLGLLILQFQSKQEMQDKLNRIKKLVKIKLDKSVMALSVPLLVVHEKIAMLI